MTDSKHFHVNRLINRQGITLGIFALVVAIVLTLTQQATKNTIAANESAQHQKALTEVLGTYTGDHQLQETPLVLLDENTNRLRQCYLVNSNGQTVAVVITATAKDGYSGSIDMLVGINMDGVVTGVRVTGHTETPGLGDAIEIQKSEWIKSFDGKSLSAPADSKWTVRKHGGEFDQFTGATITPRAVVNEVKNTLQFFHTVRENLF